MKINAPRLTHQEEMRLIAHFRMTGCIKSRDKVITAHLPLAKFYAGKYARGNSQIFSDMMSEACIGMLKAIEKFDPLKGARFNTYAAFWIRNEIYRFAYENYSLVKLSTSVSQHKLFSHLNKIRASIKQADEDSGEEIAKIAEILGVSEKEVVYMSERMSGKDASLNAPVSGSDGEATGELGDFLVDPNVDTEGDYAEKEEEDKQMDVMAQAVVNVLTTKERDIFIRTRIDDPPMGMVPLAEEYGVTHQRISQISTMAFHKVRKESLRLAQERGLIPVRKGWDKPPAPRVYKKRPDLAIRNKARAGRKLTPTEIAKRTETRRLNRLAREGVKNG